MLQTAIILAKIWGVLLTLVSLAAIMTWVERKQSAVMQDRLGANRADVLGLRIIGLFQPMADGLKMFFKEDFVPARGDKFLHTLAPMIAFFPALLTFAVIPFGDVLRIGTLEIPLQIANLNIGYLFILAFGGLTIYGTVLAGWSSNNKYSLLGGLRAGAQMISYEVVLGLSLVGLIMVFGTLQLDIMVKKQGELLFGFLPAWGIFLQPLGFLLFLPSAIAETKRVPFDLPEGESEIIGYYTEYSGMRFGLFYFAEFIEIIVLSAIMATLFFGGYQIPWLYAEGFQFPWGWEWNLPHLLVVILQIGSFFAKIAFFCWLQVLIRWTLPRFRYDQLMRLCWVNILPLAVLNIVLTGLVLMILN
ncbi:NADH-quinone oxidoreductase subunit H [candidate division LCP-89 bacterium B3_LCP]|uniref:NADH-quinone oxidoreductase subunit H n=1 Tax=candidate division LCP-89 bacterium B3_LCP TaxID=2012998 RepID=A0A532V5D9_UNCL8|nr:MAG: NADH-quinone oxidoreductase subunit H [candidate division LCP-89 bacterium B3_LCP]